MAMSAPAQPWVHPSLIVAGSLIEGKGLFATLPLEAGTIVAVFGGRLVSDGELEALLVTAEHYIDTLSVDHNVNLVVPRGTPLHFGNHSCDPTLWWAGDLSLAARRALKAGEEATLDYGTITDSSSYTMRCRCGSSLCRGRVTGRDWRRQDLQSRYGDHWVPALLDQIHHPHL